jgi:hypothetical protein
LLTAPKPRANGKNAIQVSVPTPDATPARIVDATQSWSRGDGGAGGSLGGAQEC